MSICFTGLHLTYISLYNISYMYLIIMIGNEIIMEKKRRKQWSTATDYELYEKLKGLSDKTRVPTTKLLDEAIEDLLVKYDIIKKSEKKNP